VTNTLRKIILQDPDFVHPVQLSWNITIGTVRSWNEICADGMELFGLPGDRYITHATQDSLTWQFRDPHDALLFRLKFSEHLC
jgi:hypothetical protein